MIDPKVIRAIADEVMLQITMACKAYRCHDFMMGDLHLSMGQQALLKLQRLIDADAAATQKPLRVLAIVGPRDEDADTLPAWMGRKANDGGSDGAA